MKRAWTEGPWVADELGMEDDRRVRVATTDGTPLYYHRSATICEAYVTHPALGDDLDPGEPAIGIITAEANARLIAAAPELYEALADLVAGYTSDKAKRARAALKKAEG